MSSYAYYNGKFGKIEETVIPLSDRSIFFGDAIYDAAIGSYDRILWEDEHIDRFLKNADRIGIRHSLTKKHLSQLLREIAVRSMLECYFIYFQLSRDLPTRNHSPSGCGANLLITVNPIEIPADPQPLKLITAEDLRYDFCDIKTVNLLPAVLSISRAEEKGCDEAIFIRNGIVTECSKSNISIIKQGRIITHPKTNRILPGIAREHLILNAGKIGLEIEEREFTVEELFYSDEILVTSTTKLCRRVCEIDGIPVGSKSSEVAEQLCCLAYEEFTEYCLK